MSFALDIGRLTVIHKFEIQVLSLVTAAAVVNEIPT